jgi:hypothetical protein
VRAAAVTLQTCVWEVLGSNSGRDTGYPIYRDFIRFLKVIIEMLPPIYHGHFLSNPFISTHSSVVLFCAVLSPLSSVTGACAEKQDPPDAEASATGLTCFMRVTVVETSQNKDQRASGTRDDPVDVLRYLACNKCRREAPELRLSACLFETRD